MDKSEQGLLICAFSLSFLTFLVASMVIFAVNTKKLAIASEKDALEESANATNATTTTTTDREAGAQSVTTWIYPSVREESKEGDWAVTKARLGRRRPLARHRTRAGSGRSGHGWTTVQRTSARRKSTELITRLGRTTPARPHPPVATKTQTTQPSAEEPRTVHRTPRTPATTPAEPATSTTSAHLDIMTSATPDQKAPAASATRNTTASKTESQPATVLTRVIVNALTLQKGPAVTQVFPRTTRKMVTGVLSGKEVSKAEAGASQELVPRPTVLPVRRGTVLHERTSTKEEGTASSVGRRSRSSLSAPSPETLRNQEMGTLWSTELNVTSGSSADESKRFSGSLPPSMPSSMTARSAGMFATLET